MREVAPHDLHHRVQQVFRDVFDEPELSIQADMTAADIEGWDSMAHFNLIVAIENEFAIKFATAEISRLKDDDQNVGSFMQLVAHKLAAANPNLSVG